MGAYFFVMYFSTGLLALAGLTGVLGFLARRFSRPAQPGPVVEWRRVDLGERMK